MSDLNRACYHTPLLTIFCGGTTRVFRLFALLLVLTGSACTAPKPLPEPPPVPRRIISVVPSATEMLFAFGLADRVVAVGDYDQLPPGTDKPRVGGLLNPNIERIIELKPDFVVTYGSQDGLQQRMQELGIRI